MIPSSDSFPHVGIEPEVVFKWGSPHQRCADPEISSPRQSTDFDLRSASATNYSLRSAVSPQSAIILGLMHVAYNTYMNSTFNVKKHE
jgi:hypothetical protein